MNTLTIEKRVQIVSLLVEGMSMRAISRVADVSINTVTKLLADVGQACSAFQDKTMRDLTLATFKSMKSGPSSTRSKRTYPPMPTRPDARPGRLLHVHRD